MKIRPVGAEVFHAGGRTDVHDEANSRFSKFCERACVVGYLYINRYLYLVSACY